VEDEAMMVRFRAAGIAGVLVLGGCGPSADTPATAVPKPPSAVVVAESAMVPLPVELPSQLYVEHDAVLYARAQGIIQRVNADIGARVSAGEALGQLESTDEEIALARAQDSLDIMQRTAARTRELARGGGVTAADSEAAESGLHQAELNLRQARRDLELTRVVTPFAGVVSARYARAGRLVGRGDSLFRVTALAPLLAAVQVPESLAAGIRVGGSATVTGADGTVAGGRVIRAAPIVDAASGTRQYVVQVEPARRLVPGAAVTVRLAGAPQHLVLVPRDVISPDGLALVWDHGRATARPVTTGSSTADGRIAVTHGIMPGDTILRPGS
jgi:RND family efflux transporter MFP subunit